MMAGAADDRSIGEPGLHHWFEHVPFQCFNGLHFFFLAAALLGSVLLQSREAAALLSVLFSFASWTKKIFLLVDVEF